MSHLSTAADNSELEKSISNSIFKLTRANFKVESVAVHQVTAENLQDTETQGYPVERSNSDAVLKRPKTAAAHRSISFKNLANEPQAAPATQSNKGSKAQLKRRISGSVGQLNSQPGSKGNLKRNSASASELATSKKSESHLSKKVTSKELKSSSPLAVSRDNVKQSSGAKSPVSDTVSPPVTSPKVTSKRGTRSPSPKAETPQAPVLVAEVQTPATISAPEPIKANVAADAATLVPTKVEPVVEKEKHSNLDPVIDTSHMIVKPKHLPKKSVIRLKKAVTNRPIIPVVKKFADIKEKKPCHNRKPVDFTSTITALRQEINTLKVELGDEHVLIEQLQTREKQLLEELDQIKNNVKEISSQNARLLLNHQKKAYIILIAKFRLEIRNLKFERNSLFDPVLELKYFPHLPITNFGNSPRKPPVGIIGNAAERSTDFFSLNPPPPSGNHPEGGHRWWWGEAEQKAAAKRLQKSSNSSINFQLGQRVSVFVEGEKCFGVVKYIGEFDGAPRSGTWAGIRLDRPTGRHDGVVKGKRYFKCEENHGFFTKIEKIKSL